MDLSALIESLQRGFGEIPPMAIALLLLAGPTVALIGYRLVSVARRMQTSPEVEAAPLWICHDCRSANELRVSHCYRCGVAHGTGEDIEIVVDQPAIRPGPVNVPAGSPFAAVAGARHSGGVPVMADREADALPVAVGPGRAVEPVSSVSEEGRADLVEADR
jgi:hypothetical protein